MRVSIIRVLGGVAFVLAGLLAYYGITFGHSVFLLFMFAGAAVIVVAVTGHRPRGRDIAIFILGVLVLSGVAAGYAPGNRVTTCSATTDQVHATKIALSVSATTGSVSIFFRDKGNLAYQVNFSRSLGPFALPFVGENTVTNSTSGGVFTLKITSSMSGVEVFLRHGYSVSISATAGTGSIDLAAPSSEDVRSVSLSTTTGSVNAVVDSSTIESLDLHTTTGSISLVSNHLGTSGQKVPVSLSTSLGSLSIRLNISVNVAVSLKATTGLGSINHDLVGFSVTTDKSNNLVASAGSPETAPRSFLVSTSTNLGSQDLTIKILPLPGMPVL
ncbi:MAG: hypothetical protein ABSB29_03195 [Nitrososphaerales archaeon]